MSTDLPSRPRTSTRVLVVVAVVAAALAAALGAWLLLHRDATPAATALKSTPTVVYELRPEGAKATQVRVEVAADEQAREVGLSKRGELPEGTGMVFLFPEAHDGPFWMKDTLVPLSIAFLDGDGKVLALREMTPCRADPCRLYDPGTAYTSALEMPARAFEHAGIKPGDVVVPQDPGALPSASS